MYLIPRNVTARFEFFPGFGLHELGLTLAGAVAGGVLALLAFILPLPARLILFVLPPAGMFFLTRPSPSGESVLDLIRRWRRFSRSQRLYLYETGRGQ